jgi:hypothetical protein
MKSWVSAKILWNPSLDEKELVQDFIYGHYGPAAPAIAEYDDFLVKAGKDHAKDLASPPGGIRYPMDVSFLSKDFCTRGMEILQKAKKQAGDDKAIIKRVERAMLPILYVQCVRGPAFVGDSYRHVVSEMERIAKNENFQYIEEAGATFPAKLAEWKKQIPQPKPATQVI